MSRADAGQATPHRGNDPSLHGDALLRELRVGWAPLPKKTLLAMAMGGLRVRMMRSTVTMLSVVLAIAFLAYTGLSNHLTHNLSAAVQRLGGFEAVKPEEAAAAAGALLSVRPFADVPVEQQRRLARDLGLAETDQIEARRIALPPQLRTAEDVLAKAKTKLEETLKDPARLAADEETAGKAVADAEAQVAILKREQADLQSRAELAAWIKGDGAGGAADLPERLVASLTARYRGVIGLLRSPGRMTAEDLDAAGRLVGVAAAKVDPGPARVAGEVVAQERLKRDQTELITRLRRAGVDWEANLRGSSVMDYWLITMALLTCAIGIANAMLMSVTERFREIGTMKCLGAQDGLVIQLFLLESAFLGVIGAVMGIVLGIVVALAASLLQYGGFGPSYFPWAQSWMVIVWSVVAGVLLTVVGAFGPARMASRMRPVDALRVDE